LLAFNARAFNFAIPLPCFFSYAQAIQYALDVPNTGIVLMLLVIFD